MKDVEQVAVLQPKERKNKRRKPEGEVTEEQAAETLAASEQVRAEVGRQASQLDAVGRVIDRRLQAFAGQQVELGEAAYDSSEVQRQNFISAASTLEGFRQNGYRDLARDEGLLALANESLSYVGTLHDEAFENLTKVDRKAYQKAQGVLGNVGSAEQYETQEQFTAAKTKVEAQAQAILEGHQAAADLVQLDQYQATCEADIRAVLKAENLEHLRLFDMTPAQQRAQISKLIEENLKNSPEYQALAKILEGKIDIRSKRAKQIMKFMNEMRAELVAEYVPLADVVATDTVGLTASYTKLHEAGEGTDNAATKKKSAWLRRLYMTAGLILVGSKVHAALPGEPGADHHGPDLAHLEGSIPSLTSELAQLTDAKDLIDFTHKLQDFLEGGHYKGVNYQAKLTAEQLAKLSPVEQQLAKKLVAETYHLLHEAEDKAFKATLAENPELLKIAQKPGELKGPAGEDCKNWGYEATPAGFLKLCFDRSIKVLNGVENYLESPDNQSGIKAEQMTPEVKAFLAKYMTLGGYESGRVGKLSPAEAAYDAVYQDYAMYTGKIQAGEGLNKLSADERATYEATKAEVLAKIGEKSLKGLAPANYKPAPGNVEFAMLMSIAAKHPEIIEAMQPKDFHPELKPFEPRADSVKVDVELPEYKEPMPVTLVVDTEAIIKFMQGVDKNLDWKEIGKQLAKNFEMEKVKQVVGDQVNDLKEFWGDGKGKLTYTDQHGQEVVDKNFDIAQIMKDPKVFEAFLKAHPVEGGHMQVDFGGKHYDLTFGNSQVKTPDGKTSSFQARLERPDGFAVTLHGMHQEQPAGGSKTQNAAAFELSAPLAGDLGFKGQGTWTFDHEGKIVTGANFVVDANLGPGAHFQLKGVDVTAFTGIFELNKDTPTESKIHLKDGSTIKLGELFKKDDGIDRVWLTYHTLLSAITPESKFQVGAQFGSAKLMVEGTKQSLDRAVATTGKGATVGLENAKVEQHGRGHGEAKAERLFVSLDKPGVAMVFENAVAALTPTDQGMEASLTANGTELIKVSTSISQEELDHGTGSAKQVVEAVRELGRNLSSIIGKHPTGEGKNVHDVWENAVSKVLDNLPKDTKLNLNFGGFLAAAQGSEVAQVAKAVGEGMEREHSGAVSLSLDDLKHLDALIKQGNMIQHNIEHKIWTDTEKAQEKAQLHQELARFISEKMTGFTPNELLAHQAASLVGADAKEVMKAVKGLETHWKTVTEGTLQKSMIGFKHTSELSDHAKAVIGADIEMLRFSAFGKPGEMAEVQVVSQTFSMSAALAAGGNVGGFDLEFGAGAKVYVSMDDISATGDGGMTRIPVLQETAGKVVPIGFVFADVAKQVGGSTDIKFTFIGGPRVDLDLTKEATGGGVVKPGFGVSAEAQVVQKIGDDFKVTAKLGLADVKRALFSPEVAGSITYGGGQNPDGTVKPSFSMSIKSIANQNAKLFSSANTALGLEGSFPTGRLGAFATEITVGARTDLGFNNPHLFVGAKLNLRP